MSGKHAHRYGEERNFPFLVSFANPRATLFSVCTVYGCDCPPSDDTTAHPSAGNVAFAEKLRESKMWEGVEKKEKDMPGF